jgi:hypothetical protein
MILDRPGRVGGHERKESSVANGEVCIAEARHRLAEITDHADGKVAGERVRNQMADRAMKNPVCSRLAIRPAN